MSVSFCTRRSTVTVWSGKAARNPEKKLIAIRPRFLIGSSIMIDDIRCERLVQHSKVSAAKWVRI